MMKFTRLIVALLALLSAATANATRPDQESLSSMQLTTNPLSDVIGLYGAQVDFGVSDNLAIGPEATLIRANYLFDQHYSGYSVGGHASIYLSGPRFTDGWVVSPFFGYLSYTATDNFTIFSAPTYSGDFKGYYGGILGGYQWTWDNTVSFTLGAGATAYSIGRNQTLKAASGSTEGYQPVFGGVNPTIQANLGIVL
jgi:hypothetical protein